METCSSSGAATVAPGARSMTGRAPGAAAIGAGLIPDGAGEVGILIGEEADEELDSLIGREVEQLSQGADEIRFGYGQAEAGTIADFFHGEHLLRARWALLQPGAWVKGFTRVSGAERP